MYIIVPRVKTFGQGKTAQGPVARATGPRGQPDNVFTKYIIFVIIS